MIQLLPGMGKPKYTQEVVKDNWGMNSLMTVGESSPGVETPGSHHLLARRRSGSRAAACEGRPVLVLMGRRFLQKREYCIVLPMKRYSAAEAKQQFSLLLDTVERGEAVVIERRGVRFRVRTEQRATRKKIPQAAVIEIVDPAIRAGNWKWDWESEGLRFVATKRGRR